MTGEVFDSGIFCPLCHSAPAMEIRFTSEGQCRAVCMVCLSTYELSRENSGGFTLSVHVPYEKIIGGTGETILKELENKILPDARLDVETRRQLRKLEALGVVEAFSKEKKAFWRVTQKGLEMLSE